MNINSSTQICMGIGDPIKQSIGPIIYNKIYKELGIDDQFLYVSCQVKAEDIGDFIKGARAMGLRGITCTMPHKESVMQYLDEIEEGAKKIGAVNTIVNDSGKLVGYNTDWIGVIKPLKNITGLKGKKAAIIGAGGAARAFAQALTNEGCLVTIYNRTVDKARVLAERFNCEYLPLDQQDDISNCEIICNATSLGFGGKGMEDKLPVDAKNLNSKQIVFDAVYSPLETPLLKTASGVGAQTISGIEMYIYQGLEQVKLYTGRNAPEDTMRKLVMELMGGR